MFAGIAAGRDETVGHAFRDHALPRFRTNHREDANTPLRARTPPETPEPRSGPHAGPHCQAARLARTPGRTAGPHCRATPDVRAGGRHLTYAPVDGTSR
ncbi:hypothetical protein ACFU53_05375 [Streptomyces sp. NPDC057474]|uniref:hypothetical protein n=1 Tax=Streptomyces sp. NPDC057474 TaxID=3346144 RepID=UPI00369F8134